MPLSLCERFWMSSCTARSSLRRTISAARSWLGTSSRRPRLVASLLSIVIGLSFVALATSLQHSISNYSLASTFGLGYSCRAFCLTQQSLNDGDSRLEDSDTRRHRLY